MRRKVTQYANNEPFWGYDNVVLQEHSHPFGHEEDFLDTKIRTGKLYIPRKLLILHAQIEPPYTRRERSILLLREN